MGHTVPVRYEQQQMPDRTIRKLKQPLPVDKVMNVGEEREKAINSLPKKYIFPLIDETDAWYLPEYTHYHYINGKLKRAVISEEQYNSLLNELEDDHKKHRDKYVFNTYDYYPELLEKISKGTWIKPSRAEQNAVISIGDLEKVGTFANGGKLISKYQNGGITHQYYPNQYYPKYNPPMSDVDDGIWFKWWFSNRRKQLEKNNSESIPLLIDQVMDTPVQFENKPMKGWEDLGGISTASNILIFYPTAQKMDEVGRKTLLHERTHTLNHLQRVNLDENYPRTIIFKDCLILCSKNLSNLIE